MFCCFQDSVRRTWPILFCPYCLWSLPIFELVGCSARCAVLCGDADGWALCWRGAGVRMLYFSFMLLISVMSSVT